MGTGKRIDHSPGVREHRTEATDRDESNFAKRPRGTSRKGAVRPKRALATEATGVAKREYKERYAREQGEEVKRRQLERKINRARQCPPRPAAVMAMRKENNMWRGDGVVATIQRSRGSEKKKKQRRFGKFGKEKITAREVGRGDVTRTRKPKGRERAVPS